EFCKKIRQESEVPIIIISAKDEEIDKIIGIELGGDDYLTKPFSPRELTARVKRLFKRTHPITDQEDPVTSKVQDGHLLIYKEESRILWRGEKEEVTTKEFVMV